MKFTLRNLAAKSALVLAVALGASLPSHAGIPVLDGANLVQNIMSAVEAVAQTTKQVEQYKTQLDQYQNMLQNTAQPVTQVWDQAQSTMNSLRSSIDTLSYYKQQLGSIDAYLGKFQDVNYYKNSPCFSSSGCSAADQAALKDMERLASESQKKANDALFKGLDKQQDALQTDASTLQRLQSGAQGATGQMQALGYANQLASSQANQLLQIRGLLIAQQNAVTTRQQALVDKEARTQAATDQALGGAFKASSHKAY